MDPGEDRVPWVRCFASRVVVPSLQSQLSNSRVLPLAFRILIALPRPPELPLLTRGLSSLGSQSVPLASVRIGGRKTNLSPLNVRLKVDCGFGCSALGVAVCVNDWGLSAVASV